MQPNRETLQAIHELDSGKNSHRTNSVESRVRA
nr:type II toxin-antitoxin system RelB/DinJ family antitoxin [Xenorhabdus doucetiae]